MQKLLLLLFTLSVSFPLVAQTQRAQSILNIKEVTSTKWDSQDGIIYKQVPGANLGATSFEVIDNNRIAYLCDSSNEIIIVESVSGIAIKRFNVSFAPRDFSYSNGYFFVLTENQVVKYDIAGNEINRFSIPNGYDGIERLTRFNNATYLLLPSGNTLMIESYGHSIVSDEKEGWITSSGNYVATRITGYNSYSIKLTSEGHKNYEKVFTTDLKVAGVFVVGSTNSKIILDVQTFLSECPISIDRAIVIVELNSNGLGSIVANTKVPDCYYVLSNKDFSLREDGTIFNMITAPQGAFVFSLTDTRMLLKTQNIQGYPSYITDTKYHFNDNLMKMEER
ncbi:MAG: hypothetical protein C4517_04230 [Stygiobacter sp.]|nr:MAG: hypothetical protein C4517_04230 [Stygiobacter sp.]